MTASGDQQAGFGWKCVQQRLNGFLVPKIIQNNQYGSVTGQQGTHFIRSWLSSLVRLFPFKGKGCPVFQDQVAENRLSKIYSKSFKKYSARELRVKPNGKMLRQYGFSNARRSLHRGGDGRSGAWLKE